MGRMPRPTASQWATLVMLRYQAKEKESTEKATIIGIDLAKRVFQVHGATQDGRPSRISDTEARHSALC